MAYRCVERRRRNGLVGRGHTGDPSCSGANFGSRPVTNSGACLIDYDVANPEGALSWGDPWINESVTGVRPLVAVIAAAFTFAVSRNRVQPIYCLPPLDDGKIFGGLYVERTGERSS
jgi:hypothetical protein